MPFPRLARLVVAAGVALMPLRATAEEPSACADSYVAAQTLRQSGQLLASRTALAQCMADECAPYQRADCGRWLDEVQRDIPTVVFRVVDPQGRERTDVEVSRGDEVLTAVLDGQPLSLDPGSHTFRLRWPGAAPVERTVTIVSGEKNRMVVVDMQDKAPAPTPTPSPRPDVPTGVHPMTWVLGAVGVVGFGVFAGIGAYSVSLEKCAPLCTDDDVHDIETTRVMADVALAVGATALAAAVVVAIVTYDSGDGDIAVVTRGTGLELWMRF